MYDLIFFTMKVNIEHSQFFHPKTRKSIVFVRVLLTTSYTFQILIPHENTERNTSILKICLFLTRNR